LSGTGMMSIRRDVLELTWTTKLLLSYNRLVALPQELTALSQVNNNNNNYIILVLLFF